MSGITPYTQQCHHSRSRNQHQIQAHNSYSKNTEFETLFFLEKKKGAPNSPRQSEGTTNSNTAEGEPSEEPETPIENLQQLKSHALHRSNACEGQIRWRSHLPPKSHRHCKTLAPHRCTPRSKNQEGLDPKKRSETGETHPNSAPHSCSPLPPSHQEHQEPASGSRRTR